MGETKATAVTPLTDARWPYRVGFAVVAAVVVAVIVLVPVAVASLVQEIRHAPTAATDVLVPQGTLAADSYSVLHLDAVALDEVQRSLTLHVSGYHVCRTTCPYQDTLVFFSVRAESRVAAGLPPAASLPLPADTAPVDATISLPVDGEILFYPFDHYRLVLALAMERAVPGQPPRELPPDEVEGRLVITAQNHIPRLIFGPVQLTAADMRPVVPNFTFLGVGGVELSRPRYLQVLVVLGVLLTLAAAICTVLLRPLRELMINTGALVLGVWGIRALLLGNYPPDETIVDILLTAIIFAQLTAVTVRILHYLYNRGEIRLLPWRPRPPAFDGVEGGTARPAPVRSEAGRVSVGTRRWRTGPRTPEKHSAVRHGASRPKPAVKQPAPPDGSDDYLGSPDA